MRYYFFVGGVSIVTAVIGYGTFATAQLLKTWQPDRNLLLIPAENAIKLGIIILCLGLGWFSGLSLDVLGWSAPQPLQQLTGGLAAGLGMGTLFYLGTRWLVARTGQTFYSSAIITYILPANHREYWLILLAMIPAVVLEELLFRSLLLGGLSALLPLWLLVTGLSILFGLLHSPQGIWGMTGAGLAGLALAGLFLWQHSLLAPLIAHYTVNTVQITWLDKSALSPRQ